jgi:bifunctional DNase/RNase
MIRVTVDSIRVNLLSQQRMVMLREVDKQRYLPIWIDTPVAESIVYALQGHEPPRPMTHDLLRNVIQELGGSVEYIAITQLTDQVFHAELVVEVRGVRRQIDSRPSDAIALALRLDAPIYVAEQVLDQAAMTLEEDEEEEEADDFVDRARSLESQLPGKSTPPREETEEREVNDESLSLFRDFINSLENKQPPEEGK